MSGWNYRERYAYLSGAMMSMSIGLAGLAILTPAPEPVMFLVLGMAALIFSVSLWVTQAMKHLRRDAEEPEAALRDIGEYLDLPMTNRSVFDQKWLIIKMVNQLMGPKK